VSETLVSDERLVLMLLLFDPMSFGELVVASFDGDGPRMGYLNIEWYVNVPDCDATSTRQ
jgi:hypothetical protein